MKYENSKTSLKYTVQKGDCLTTIAHKFGFRKLDTLWNDPENKELKEKRKNGNILFEGDIVHIPALGTDKQPLDLGRYNTFTVPVLKTYLKLRLLNAGEPRANEKFDLKLWGREEIIKCTTDADGKIEEIIPDDLKRASFDIGKNEHHCILNFGHLDPINKKTGVHARLRSLHFLHHGKDGGQQYADGAIYAENHFIKNSIKRFQFAFDEEEKGKINDELKSNLEEKYEKNQSWKCKPKEEEIPYKLPNKETFYISRNSWNTIDIVDSPDIALDSHMHIQSANCAPLPLTWSSVHRVALLIRAKRSTLQDKG